MDHALGDARLIVAAADVAARPLRGDAEETGALAARDRYMAQEVISLAERSAGKVAVWTHNGHVSTDRYAETYPPWGSTSGITTVSATTPGSAVR
ncbi:erythromycin esterase family protein [Streptomyces sp. NPDC005202]|uniref:erythromycin esterase family protein n=1 Tax=Streptomyces sp. NPDC005202 TaxID=3157021 RepID=UPI0033BD5EC2